MRQVFDKHYMLNTLKSMMAENLKEPKWGLTKRSRDTFEVRCYQKWAFNELLREIKTSDKPPDMVVSDWTEKVTKYSTYNPYNKKIFEIAMLVGEMVEDIILGMV